MRWAERKLAEEECGVICVRSPSLPRCNVQANDPGGLRSITGKYQTYS